MKTYRVTVTYPRQKTFEATLRADDETSARRQAARLAAACGWDELPKTITTKQVEERAA